jgi:hypothetical protein
MAGNIQETQYRSENGLHLILSLSSSKIVGGLPVKATLRFMNQRGEPLWLNNSARGLDPRLYRAIPALSSTPGVFSVSFIDQNIPPERYGRGNPSPDRPGLQVNINARDLSLRDSRFTR